MSLYFVCLCGENCVLIRKKFVNSVNTDFVKVQEIFINYKILYGMKRNKYLRGETRIR